MAIDFPNSPTNGQTYSVGDKMWTYNSADNKWLLSSVSPDSGTLTTKGDLLTRSSSAITRLGAGSNGDLLVADSGATEGLRWQGQTNTGRNLVINGAMQVHQRGTSATGRTTLTYLTADRWTGYATMAGTWTQTVENDGPTGSVFRKSLKMLCTTANNSLSASSELTLYQSIEGQNLQQFLKGSSNAKQFALSFWVKSNVTGTYIFELYDTDNSRAVSASYTISTSATWEKKTIIFPADTTGLFDNDNAQSLNMAFFLSAGSGLTTGTLATSWVSPTSANRAVGQVNLASAINNYWQVTGVQLEVGPVATGFDFEPYETTLRKCQRYFQRIGGEFLIHTETSTRAWSVIKHPEMRTGPVVTTPSLPITNGINDPYVSLRNITSMGVSTVNARSIQIEFGVSAGGMTLGRPMLYIGGDFLLSAEL